MITVGGPASCAQPRCPLPRPPPWASPGRATGATYAVKIINKHLVMRHKAVDYVRTERAILDRLDHPGIARLHFTFQVRP